MLLPMRTVLVAIAISSFILLFHIAQAGSAEYPQASTEELRQLKSECLQLIKQRKYSEAILLGEKALKISQKMNGEKSEDTAICYNNLAVAYSYTGDFKKAESFAQKALTMILEMHGEKYDRTGKYYYNLAAMYFEMGDYGKAEPLFQKAFTIIKEIYSENSSELDTYYYDLASRYIQKGNYDKAEPLINKCVTINKEGRGKNDLPKAERYEVLSSLYRKMGREDKAKALEQEALKLRNEHLAKTKLLETSSVLKKAETELNEVYKSCIAILNADAQGRLKNGQENWVKQRAGRLESDSRGIKEAEKSILDDTNQRITQLKGLRSSPFQWMLKTSGSTAAGVNPGNLPKETLSVSFKPAGNPTVEAGSPIDVSWTLNHTPVQPDKVYDFVVLSMPNSVRLKGEGFMVLPPQQDLPFGVKYNLDKFRVVFPLYLLKQNKTWSFVVRPLVAGRFDIEWSYLALDRKTRQLVFASEEPNRSTSFEVLDAKPKIIVQDRLGGDTPKDVRVSYSGAYELRTYENYFEIYQAATGRLILREAGTEPEFSSTSRFLAYFALSRPVVLDLLNTEPISFPDGLSLSTGMVAWARGDSSMILGGFAVGAISILNPYLDSQRGISSGRCRCAACDSLRTGLVYDRETALVGYQCTDWDRDTEVNDDREVCESSLGDLSAEILGYDACNAWTSYLNQLGLEMPTAPHMGWVFSGGLHFSHGISEVSAAQPSQEDDPESQAYQMIIRSVQKSILRSPQKASFSEGHSEIISSAASKLTYASNPDAAEEALANRLKEKGLNFPKNSTLEEGPAIRNTDKVLSKAKKILDKVFPEEGFIKSIGGYWQYSGGVHGGLTLLRMHATQGIGSGTNTVEALVLMDSKGNWIDLAEKLGRFIKSSPQKLTSNPLELTSWDYYGGGTDINVFASTNDTLLISLVDHHTNDQIILLYDLKQNRFLSVIKDVTEAYNLQSLRLSQDGRYVLQVNKGGPFFIYDVQKSKRILNGVYVDDEWVLYTDAGSYDSTTEGGHFVSWYYPGLREHFDFNQFESAYKKPELIKEILSGRVPNLPSMKPAPPPRVTLASDATLTETTDKSYTLNASISAQDSVQTVRIFVNGEPVKEMPIGAKTGQVSAEVPLVSGLNRISAIAYNEKGFSSNLKYVDVLCKNEEVPKPDLYVLTVGISQYPKLRKEWQLSFAHSDAGNLAGAFKAQEKKLFGNVYTKTLANEEATPTSITAELKALERVAEKDLFVIMLAGHGIRSKDGTFYFLTPSGQFDAPEMSDGALSWEILGQYIEKIRGRVILLLDACHSGGISTETVVPNDDLAKKFFAKGKGGVTILAASKGRQASLESPDLGGGFGVFTYGIVQALSAKAAEADIDGNGFVEWLELVKNVSAFVHNETKGEQTPWLVRSEIFGDFPIAVGQRRQMKMAEVATQLPPPYMGQEIPASERPAESSPTKQRAREASVSALPAPPAAQTEPGDKRSNTEAISKVVRSYYQFVQSKQIDQAISCYASSKQPKIKKGVLEAIAKDTESYKIGKIEPTEIRDDRATLKIELFHKKHGKPEEVWEVNPEFVNEQGEWKILSTPGKKVR